MIDRKNDLAVSLSAVLSALFGIPLFWEGMTVNLHGTYSIN